MVTIRVQNAASYRLDEIYRFTRDQWGEEQAKIYLTGLFETFDRIGLRTIVSKPISAQFGVDGFFCRYEKHVVYWRVLSDGAIGIVTILHERMHQIDRFRADFEV